MKYLQPLNSHFKMKFQTFLSILQLGTTASFACKSDCGHLITHLLMEI